MMLEIQFLAWTSNFRSLNIEKTMIYDVGNPVPGLGQAQKCRRNKPVLCLHYLPFILLLKP